VTNRITYTNAYWAATARRLPTWALEEELRQRCRIQDEHPRVVLPGLVVDPIQNLVVWRGEEHVIGGRKMQVLYEIARAVARGVRGVTCAWLAATVWRGYAETAVANARVVVHELKKVLPGLVVSKRRLEVVYCLALDDQTEAVA